MHAHSLISTFVVCCLDHIDSIITMLAKSKISRLQLVFLSLTWSQTPEDRFSYGVVQIYSRRHLSHVDITNWYCKLCFFEQVRYRRSTDKEQWKFNQNDWKGWFIIAQKIVTLSQSFHFCLSEHIGSIHRGSAEGAIALRRCVFQNHAFFQQKLFTPPNIGLKICQYMCPLTSFFHRQCFLTLYR